jgi:hypothetical protein
MTRKFSLFVEDILDAIVWIEQFTHDMDFKQFVAERLKGRRTGQEVVSFHCSSPCPFLTFEHCSHDLCIKVIADVCASKNPPLKNEKVFHDLERSGT